MTERDLGAIHFIFLLQMEILHYKCIRCIDFLNNYESIFKTEVKTNGQGRFNFTTYTNYTADGGNTSDCNLNLKVVKGNNQLLLIRCYR